MLSSRVPDGDICRVWNYSLDPCHPFNGLYNLLQEEKVMHIHRKANNLRIKLLLLFNKTLPISSHEQTE